MITDESINMLTNLTSLDLGYENSMVTDKSVIRLTNLISLWVYNNTVVTDASISKLTNLTSLMIGFNNYFITDASVSMLTNLTYLDIYEPIISNMVYDYDLITNKSFSKLTKLAPRKQNMFI